MTDTDVIITGAGPTGLMLAAELRLAGVRTLVLERQLQPGGIPKANGFSGQILEVLRHRGLLERFEAAATGPSHPAPAIPFGGVQLDLSGHPDHPLEVLGLAQPRLERVLDAWAGELGARIERGHTVTAVHQDEESVTASVDGPHGRYRATARYLVGCDGTRSTVREAAGIAFVGVTYPEVNRLAEAGVHESVTVLDGGDLDVPGVGRVRAGFTRTERGVFALGRLRSGALLVQTTEESADDVDQAPMTTAELQDSIRRLLGHDLPLGEVSRLSRYTMQARQADRYRAGRIFLAGDAAHQFPATGIGINMGMLDAVNLAWKLAGAVHGWAPAALLDTYHAERHHVGARAMLQTQAQVALRRGQDAAAEALRELFSELLRDRQPQHRMAALVGGADLRYPMPDGGRSPVVGTFAPSTLHPAGSSTGAASLLERARPVLLDLADRADLRAVAEGWRDRLDVRTAPRADRPADVLLIRPDAHIAWAASADEPVDRAASTLRLALGRWFGDER